MLPRRRTVALLRALVEHSGDAIAILHADGRVRSTEGAVQEVLGRRPETLRGVRIAELVHPEDRGALAALGAPRPARELVLRVRHPGGFWLPVSAVITDLRGDRAVRGLVLRMRDASEQLELESQLRARALHDPLTGLPNRVLFADRIEQALQAAARDRGLVCVAFLDLDDFKEVNDTLGHAAGDELLVAVADRLRGALRATDTAARLGGDEFAALLHGVAERSEVDVVAQRLLDALSEPHEVGGELRTALPSIGLSIAGAGASAEDLMRRADAAMYAAKRAGKGRFELYLREADETRAESEAEVAPAWFVRAEQQRDEVLGLLDAPLSPALAPIMSLRSGALAGHEALPRFDVPDDRPPAAWLAQARRCGLGSRLEAEVLRAALAAPGRPHETFLALNLPAYALDAEEVTAVLPSDLAGIVVEIDEASLLAAGEGLDLVLARLRRRGARLAVDGVAAGYGGLRMLMRLRPELVKLDRALVESLAEDLAAQTLVESFVRLARGIGADVCAEGVEEVADLHALARLDVAYAQGRAVGPPAERYGRPAAEAAEAVSRRRVAVRKASTAPPETATPPSPRSSR